MASAARNAFVAGRRNQCLGFEYFSLANPRFRRFFSSESSPNKKSMMGFFNSFIDIDISWYFDSFCTRFLVIILLNNSCFITFVFLPLQCFGLQCLRFQKLLPQREEYKEEWWEESKYERYVYCLISYKLDNQYIYLYFICTSTSCYLQSLLVINVDWCESH